jgi:RHS repeat-associated protein
MGHLGPWYESVSPENKYLFNGIELEDASDMNVYMAVFRTYDPAIGRWWQVDPRYDVQVSPYAGFGNNPIRLADPLGDTTRVYGLNGEFLFAINDSYANEDHFMVDNDGLLSSLRSLAGQNGTIDMAGGLARALSSYYIGGNTRLQMEAIAKMSDGEGAERGFVLGFSGSSKELQAIDISDKIGSRGQNYLKGMDAAVRSFSEGYDGTVIGSGHTHPKVSNRYLNSIGRLNMPSIPTENHSSASWSPNDYSPLGIINKNTGQQGGNPAIIASHHGYSIYTTLVRDYNSHQGYRPGARNPARVKDRVFSYRQGHMKYQQP